LYFTVFWNHLVGEVAARCGILEAIALMQPDDNASDLPARGTAAAVVELVASAVRSLIGPGSMAERVAEASEQIGRIDSLGLRQALIAERIAEQQSVMNWVEANRSTLRARSTETLKRGPMSEATRVCTYRRDAFTCRYERCRTRTIYLPVLRELGSLLPEQLGTNSNWRPLEQHIVYWTCTTTLEHRVSFPSGGTDTEDNYLTACSQCQYAKNEYPLAETVWKVDEAPANIPPPAAEACRWDGLSWSLAAMRVALGRPIGDVWNLRPLVGVVRPGNVVRKLSGGYLHRVDEVDEAEPRRVLMRALRVSDGQLVAARNGRWVNLVDGEWGEVLAVMTVPSDTRAS
jgi:hypothetical protein